MTTAARLRRRLAAALQFIMRHGHVLRLLLPFALFSQLLFLLFLPSP